MEIKASGPGAGRSISVIFPALNEAATIRDTIAAVPLLDLRRRGFRVEILVVDNDSADQTAVIARQAQVRLVREYARGYGRALRTGFAHASGDIIVFADADGTYPLERLEGLLQPILSGQADVVTGSRLRGRIRPGAMPRLHRYVGVPVLTVLLRLLFRVPVTDGHCGMRALTRQALARLQFHTTGMEFATEFLIRAAQAGLRVAEIPIDYSRRSPISASKLKSFRDGWRHLRLMATEYFRSAARPVDRPDASPTARVTGVRMRASR